MTLYEFAVLTFVVISVLVLAFSGELFDVFLTKHERDCHARNEQLLRDGAHGPLQQC